MKPIHTHTSSPSSLIETQNTWCTVRDWTCFLSTIMRSLLTTVETKLQKFTMHNPNNAHLTSHQVQQRHWTIRPSGDGFYGNGLPPLASLLCTHLLGLDQSKSCHGYNTPPTFIILLLKHHQHSCVSRRLFGRDNYWRRGWSKLSERTSVFHLFRCQWRRGGEGRNHDTFNMHQYRNNKQPNWSPISYTPIFGTGDYYMDN